MKMVWQEECRCLKLVLAVWVPHMHARYTVPVPQPMDAADLLRLSDGCMAHPRTSVAGAAPPCLTYDWLSRPISAGQNEGWAYCGDGPWGVQLQGQLTQSR